MSKESLEAMYDVEASEYQCLIEHGRKDLAKTRLEHMRFLDMRLAEKGEP